MSHKLIKETSNKNLQEEDCAMATDLARAAVAGSMSEQYQHLLALRQQQFDEQVLLNFQQRNTVAIQRQLQEHLKLTLQKQNEQDKLHPMEERHHQRSELTQAVLNKDNDSKSANASNAVKQHLQKFVIERQKGKQLDNMIDRNRPMGWNPNLNVNGLHEIAAPYPMFFDKRNSFPLRKTASEPNLKVPSKIKQNLTLDRRNSPLVTRNSAEVRSELANKLKRKMNSAEQEVTNSAPNSGPSSPLNNSHGEGGRTTNTEVDLQDYQRPLRLMGPMTQGRDLYTSPSLPNLSLGITQNKTPQESRLGQGVVMYQDPNLQRLDPNLRRLAVTRTASLPGPLIGLPGFHVQGLSEAQLAAVKFFQQQQQQLLAEMNAGNDQSPGPIRHSAVSRPHKVLSRTHSAPTTTPQLHMQQLHRKRFEQQKMMNQQHHKHLPHSLPGIVPSTNEYYQRLPTHKEATASETNKPPARSRVHLAASPPPTHPSAISSTTAAALQSHLRQSKMHGSFPILAQKSSKRSTSPPLGSAMDHSPLSPPESSARSVIVSAPSSNESQRRVSSDQELEKEDSKTPTKTMHDEANHDLSTLSPLLAQKKLAAMAVNDEGKHSRRSMLDGFHRPLTRTQSSPAVSFTQKTPNKEYKFTTCLAYDPIMLRHGCACGDPHAEHAGRLKEIWSRLTNQNLVSRCESIEPRKATMEELQLAHTYEHTLRYGASPLARQQSVLRDKFIVLPCGGLGVNNNIDIDTVWNEQDTINAARMAVGLTVDLAMLVANGNVKNGFAVVRPPGHHAEKNLAMAFCYFNAVAVAARKLQNTLPDKVRRVLIVDWDAHHCNGTQDIFYEDPSVLVVSIHRYDEGNFFPGTGAPEETGSGTGVGFNINIGFSGGVDPEIGDAEYLSAFRSIVMPIAEEFKPDFVFISAGFSASDGHPPTLGGYKVTPQCFSYLTKLLSNLAGGNLVMALEGGFELGPLCDCVEACVRTLLSDKSLDHVSSQLPRSSVEKLPCETSNRSLNKIGRIQERYWSGLKRSSSTIRLSHEQWLKHLHEDVNCRAMASLTVEQRKLKPTPDLEKELGKARVIQSSNLYPEPHHINKPQDDEGESKLVIVTDETDVHYDEMSATSSPVDVVGMSSPSPPTSTSPVPSPGHTLQASSKSGIASQDNIVPDSSQEAMEEDVIDNKDVMS